MGLKKFRDKIVETNIKRYGTNRPQLLEQFQDKAKQTNLKKFGTEILQQLKNLKIRQKKPASSGMVSRHRNRIKKFKRNQ